MSEQIESQPSVLNRAWSQIARTVKEIGPRRRSVDITLKPGLPEGDEDRLAEAFQECIDHRGGEVAARARAAAIGQAYLGLNEDGRRRFAILLAERFDIDRPAVDEAIEAVRTSADAEARSAAESRLRNALEAPRMRVLTQFNDLPDGVKFLVDFRAELLDWQREAPVLRHLQQDLQRLLTSWFDIGFLELKQLDWDASAALLEKLIRYEAVHRIRSWDDMKSRLDFDRRCYAFFHPRMPDEPLIFVEIALVDGIAGDVGALLDTERAVGDARTADTAIFYSISNAQRGLAGISFGDFLIKRVVTTLSAELPNLKQFSTLSPIPGLSRWMRDGMGETVDGDALKFLSADENKSLRAAIDAAQAVLPVDDAATGDGITGDGITGGAVVGSVAADEGASDDAAEALLEQNSALLADEASDQELIAHALTLEYWSEDEKLASALEQPLLRIAADYLLNRKGRGGRALDPVAHFHLSNGARMERLNWRADRSGNGIRQSSGMMINYLYLLSKIDENHESYAAPDRVIPVSSGIKALAKR